MAGKTNNTKNKIIEVTIKKIDEIGFSNISLRKLSSELGLTTGAFYKHFATKEQLWSAATIEISKEFAKTNASSISEDYPPEEKILRLANGFIYEFQNHPNLMDFLFFNPTSKNNLLLSVTEFPYLKLIDELISEVIIDKNLHKDKQTLFLQLWSFIQGYGLLIKNGSTHMDQKLIQRTLNEFLKE